MPHRPLTTLAVAVLCCSFSRADQPPPAAVTITPLPSGVHSSFRAIAVRSAVSAIIGGTQGTIVQTRDGGRSWTRLSIPDADALDFRDLAWRPDGSILAMSAGNGSQSRVFRSTDGGLSWTCVLTNTDPQGFFDGMAFSGDHGLLYGDPIDGRIDIYRTMDGGAHWRRLPERSRPQVQEGEYGFAASGSGIYVLKNRVWIATGGTTARVHRSNDLGATWAVTETKLRHGNKSSGIFSVDFYNDSLGIVVGGDYLKPQESQSNIALTNDGGRTWQMPNVDMPHKACVRYLSATVAVACGRTGVMISSDAGQTWRTVTTDGYYVLGWNRESHSGFLAGADGRVAKLEVRLPAVHRRAP